MKKYISLLSFIALFFVGIQQSQAQNTNRVVEAEMPEAIAKKQTHTLHQMAELSGDQQRAVYKIFLDYQQNVSALNENSDITSANRAKSSLMDSVTAKLKSTLNEEQFQTYLKTLDKPK
jgi:hypothetical protein